MLHDCHRMDEGWDPEHGARAADVATNSRPLRDILTDQEIDRLAFACLWHEKGGGSARPTMSAFAGTATATTSSALRLSRSAICFPQCLTKTSTWR